MILIFMLLMMPCSGLFSAVCCVELVVKIRYALYMCLLLTIVLRCVFMMCKLLGRICNMFLNFVQPCKT